MPVPHENFTAGWAIAGSVVLLMAGLLFFSNGRSTHAKWDGNAPHAETAFHAPPPKQ